ncbi:hypothetical protein RRG08_067164 [Elysia crispata]|uniref:Uncharacterized protein n=1 Tax=Elysia crispata TaxID=231223 RepID=A0AAE0Z659_9GAST|nr:hypothetical protein RRG08_067164 [Elysia crispata]
MALPHRLAALVLCPCHRKKLAASRLPHRPVRHTVMEILRSVERGRSHQQGHRAWKLLAEEFENLCYRMRHSHFPIGISTK